jgi:hypothetical protein
MPYLVCLLMATPISLMNTPLEPLLTPLSHFPRSTLSTPLSLFPFPSSTSPPYDPSVPLPQSLVLDLSLRPPQPLTSQPCSGDSVSTPLLHSHPTASVPLARPTKRLLFRSPLLKGEGVKQALAWNREQLLDLRRLWELRRQRRIETGLIPMARPPSMISDDALDAENKINIAMGTLQSSPIHPSTSHLPNLKFQCSDLFRPTVWRGLTSIVRRPQRWQLNSSMPSKTTKIPLRFRRPTTTAEKSPKSSRRASGSVPLSLPKGWVYEAEQVSKEVKGEVVDPTQYLMLDAPLTRSKRKAVEQLDDPHRRHRRALSITAAPLTSLSRFPLALSPKTKRTRSYTSCESTHVTSGVNTRQMRSNLTGIRTMETTAWQLDA